MTKSLKKKLIFFLIILCVVIIYNYITIRQSETENVIARVQERERVFLQKRAEYIKKHGEIPIAEQKITQELAYRRGHSLISNSSSYQSIEKQDLETIVK